jgi:phosphate transport system substrate-binding protein
MKSIKSSVLLVVSLLLLAALIAACGGTSTPGAPASDPSADNSTVTLSGSTTVQPLAEKLAEAFMTENTGVRIDVQGGGSSVGVKAAGQGTSDIGMASREIKDSELAEFPNLKIFVIARDGIAIVAHPDVPVSDLTVEQVRDIFSGKITNWKDLGGDDQNIFVVSREEGSGTRAAFEEMVMGEDALIAASAILQASNGAIRTTVSTTPYSIAYLSFGYLDDTVKSISIDGVAPTEPNAADGSYPIVRPLNMLTNGEPAGMVKAFLDFILSEAGQKLVVEDGYIPVK